MKTNSSGHIEFTVIAGTLKGRRIRVPDRGVTRPPLTRLRRSIFDFLTPRLQDAAYLDLFSGTGSYLFEAVSRGVRSATGVEKEPSLAEAINRQAQAFGIAQQLTCRCEDVLAAIPVLESQKRQFDIIMMAPPQYVELVDRTLSLLRKHPLSTSRGLIICQHDSSETRSIDFLDYPIAQQRVYGNTTYTVLGR